MNRTTWESIMALRSFMAKMRQRQFIYGELDKNQENEKYKIFEKELNAIVTRVIELASNINITRIYIHINEKNRKIRGNVIKVSVSAEGEYTRNVYFHCTWKEAYSLIKEALKKDGIPFQDANTFDGLVIDILYNIIDKNAF